MSNEELPRIAVLGAGPIGLEATLYARYLGYPVQLYERGKSATANIQSWGHVQLFTPFRQNASTLGVAALQAQDPAWQCPGAASHLTGDELVCRYWQPLAASDLVASALQCETEVVAIGRQDWLKGEGVGDPVRGDGPFSLLLRRSDGSEMIDTADIVIDCTGTFGNHNWLGSGGIPAPGECAAAEHIEYGLPDVLGRERPRYAGKHTLVVGAGYSAATAIVQLAELSDDATRVTWITRRNSEEPIARIANDQLPARDGLAAQANQLAAGNSRITHYPATTVASVQFRTETDDFAVILKGQHAGESTFDHIIANVGYRPDNRLYSELQVHECYASGAPMKLAAQLHANADDGPADCLNQTSHGPMSLTNPEPNFYILGSKSYGRGAQFLLSIGLEQIRDVFTLIGDRAGLDLYATMPSIAKD